MESCARVCALPFTGTTMCQKGDFSEWKTGAVVFGQEHGCSFQEVAKFFGQFKSTANSVHIPWKQYESSIMTNLDYRHLWHLTTAMQQYSAGYTKPVSEQTLLRQLHGLGIFSHVAQIHPKSTAVQKETHLVWAKHHHH